MLKIKYYYRVENKNIEKKNMSQAKSYNGIRYKLQSQKVSN